MNGYGKYVLIAFVVIMLAAFGTSTTALAQSGAPTGFCTIAPPDNPGWSVSGTVSLPAGCPETGNYGMSMNNSVTHYTSWTAMNNARGTANATLYFEGGIAAQATVQPAQPQATSIPANDRIARLVELDAIYRASGWEQWLRAAGFSWSGNAPEARQPEEATMNVNGESRILVIGIQVRGTGVNAPYPTCLTTDRPGEVQTTPQTVSYQPDLRNASKLYTNVVLNGQATLYVDCTDWGQLNAAAASSQQFSEQVPQHANPQGTIPGDGAQEFAGEPEIPGVVPPPAPNDGRNDVTFENFVAWFSQPSFLWGTNGQLLIVAALIALAIWYVFFRNRGSGDHATAHASGANPTHDTNHAAAHNNQNNGLIARTRRNLFGGGSAHAHESLHIKTDTLSNATAGQRYESTVEAEHASGIVIWTLEGAPVGMTIDTHGKISWPLPQEGTWTFRVKAEDDDKEIRKGFHITVNPAPTPAVTLDDVQRMINDAKPEPINYDLLAQKIVAKTENPTTGRNRGGKTAATGQ